MKPYLALDIETTGLSLDSQILQLAAVYVSSDTEMQTFNMLVSHKEYKGEATALAMNSWIFKELSNKSSNYKIADWQTVRRAFEAFLCRVQPEGKITVAGKNVAGFDLPVLKEHDTSLHMVSHRVIDVGSVYFSKFGYVPSLNEINKLNNRNAVTHDALDDCMDVVAAIEAIKKG